MKPLLICMLLVVLSLPAHAQSEDGRIPDQVPMDDTTTLRNKPVLCMNKFLMINNMIGNELTPLVSGDGNSFDGKGGVFPAYFVLGYNQSTGQYTFVEFHKDGWACVIGGGRNHLNFDPAEVDRQLNWKFTQPPYVK